jgi:cytochrome c5
LNAPALGDEARWTAITEQNIDVLVEHTVTGYRAMPALGGCKTCSLAEIKASVKYMAQKSQKNKDFTLW